MSYNVNGDELVPDIPTRLVFVDQEYELYLIVPNVEDGSYFAYYLNKEEFDENVNTRLYYIRRNGEYRLCSDNYFAASDLEVAIQDLIKKKTSGGADFRGYYISEDLQYTLEERLKEL